MGVEARETEPVIDLHIVAVARAASDLVHEAALGRAYDGTVHVRYVDASMGLEIERPPRLRLLADGVTRSDLAFCGSNKRRDYQVETDDGSNHDNDLDGQRVHLLTFRSPGPCRLTS